MSFSDFVIIIPFSLLFRRWFCEKLPNIYPIWLQALMVIGIRGWYMFCNIYPNIYLFHKLPEFFPIEDMGMRLTEVDGRLKCKK